MKKLVSVILALVIGVSASLNAFAASANKTYVSDIAAVTASTEGNAKAQLIKAGYKFIENSNVNSSLKTDVYLGYKETEDPDEALTDIAAMNMKGKYSYSDYEQIMEQFRDNISQTVADFVSSIAEFQSNYERGAAKAQLTYDALNVYRDDDSKKLIGDYLLEYDFTEEAEKELTDVFMQANTSIVLTIMREVAFSADDDDTTLFERMEKTGADGVAARYMKAYPTVAKANQAMNAEYGETADVIYKDWNAFYSYLCSIDRQLKNKNSESESAFSIDYTESEEISISDDGKAEECIDEICDTVKKSADITDYMLYALLGSTKFSSGTLLDFFKRPVNEVKKEELFTLADSMSEGQRSQVGIVGLEATVIGAFTDFDTSDEETKDTVDDFREATEKIDPVSIYSGVDRSIFEDGVAFTDKAVQHEKLTGESWIQKLTGEYVEKDTLLDAIIISSVTSAALLSIGITATVLQISKENAAKIRINYASIKNDYEVAQLNYINGVNNYADDIELINERTLVRDEALDRLNEARRTVGEAGKTARIVKYASFILFTVAFVIDICSIVDYFTVEELKEEIIPHHLMSAAQTPYGEDYVYYQTVKNLSGEAQDTNNHEADKTIGWLVLYTTKDKSAGDPILAKNLRVVNDTKSISPESSFVSLFNETGALNLTKDTYTGVKDSTGGTYILFERDESVFAQGSTITNGTAAIIGIGGLAIGAVLGAVITKLAGRKKKKEAPAKA